MGGDSSPGMIRPKQFERRGSGRIDSGLILGEAILFIIHKICRPIIGFYLYLWSRAGRRCHRRGRWRYMASHSWLRCCLDGGIYLCRATGGQDEGKNNDDILQKRSLHEPIPLIVRMQAFHLCTFQFNVNRYRSWYSRPSRQNAKVKKIVEY